MIEKLVTQIFATRNIAHLAHWKTKKYAEHVALGDFYEDVVDLLDDYVECYQGMFGLIKIDELPACDHEDILDYLQADLLFISSNRDKLSKKVAALDNMLQEIEGLYMKTVYKLTHLS